MAYSMVQYANRSYGTVAPSIDVQTSEGLGQNASFEQAIFDPDLSEAYVFMRRLQTVLIPVICVLGIIGNVLAAGTFLSPALNKTSCCFHLASKSINDIGFLVSLFIVWLYRLRVQLFTLPGVCHVTVFLTYVCGCMSVWFVVSITTENFIRFTQPRLVPRYCNVATAKKMVLGIIITSVVCYNFSLWTTGVMVGMDGTLHCTSLPRFAAIVMATTVIDTALTLIVPSIVMIFLIVTIVFKSMESFERKKRLRSAAASTSAAAAAAEQQRRNRMTPEGKMTTFLFVISFIFLMLNLPTHTIRLKLLIQVYVQHEGQSYTDAILQRIFEILLYFNFSTNCLIYLVCGERFRAVFVSMYLGRCRLRRKKKKTRSSGSGNSPVMLTQRSLIAESGESVCLTCVTTDANDMSKYNGSSC